ncbi:MAG: alkaline phosphatase family protein [Pyrinomonadaceae bacterium]
MNSVVLIFVDGLGIGMRGEHNPLAELSGDSLIAHFCGERARVPFGGRLAATDPRLGVEGRPQSASGQTTILTGKNVAKMLGRHKHGFPDLRLREVIAEHSIFRQIRDKRLGPALFANTYTPQFFSSPPRWKSATTCAVEAAALPLMRLPDLVGGHSLFHDITNETLVERGFDVAPRPPEEAGRILARLSERNRFVLFEHFITDKIGHERDRAAAREHLPKLDRFVRSCVEAVDLERTTVILTSDHGNIEDLSIRNHTLNDVPTVVWGRHCDQAAAAIGDLTHIAPTVLHLLNQ